MALGDYRTLVDRKIRDTASKISPEQRDSALGEAVKIYSSVKPRQKVQILTGDGVIVSFGLAADFEEGFSSVLMIEYPVDKQDPEFLDEADWVLYRDPTTNVQKLRLRSLVLANLKKAYAIYTTRHTLSEGASAQDTIPVADREPVAALAASFLATDLAAYYAQTAEATLTADAIAYRTKSQDYLALAKELRSQFLRSLGGASELAVPAGAALDLDVDLQSGAGDRFFHPRRFR